jgi:hypothetical protein
MLWLKRNLLLVITGVVSLALLGVAIASLLIEFNDHDSYDVSIKQLEDGINTLKGYDPTPNEANITILKDNAMVLKKFMADAEGLFVNVSNRALESGTFKILIDNTIAELTREATNNGITLPPRYRFTFGEIQSQAVVRPATIIDPLAVHLDEVRTLAGVLFQSRISSLQSLQRVQVKGEPPSSGPEFITDRNVTTNSYGVVVPYTVSFRSFSPELAGVLNRLAHTRTFMVVRKVEVQGTESSGATTPIPKMDGEGMPMAGKMPEGGPGGAGAGLGTTQPGGGARPVAPPPAGAKKAVAPTGPRSVFVKLLEEKPLLVTLHVDVIRPYKGSKPTAGAATAGVSATPGADPSQGSPVPMPAPASGAPKTGPAKKGSKMDEDSQ